MYFSGNNGQNKGASAHFVVGMLLLAWLNIAAQPCLMAMELAANTSVAPEQTFHSKHHEHAPHLPESPDCGHCPPVANNQSVPCETGAASDCEMFPGYNVDGRHFDKPVKDVSQQPVLLTLASMVHGATTVTLLLPHDIKRLKFSGDPPLNVRFCVFLK